MANSNKIQHTKKALIAALEANLSVVSYACEEVGINRSTFYKYYNEDEEFKDAVDAISEYTLDYVEHHLFKQIKEGNTTATIFYLKTKGKKRGYIEKQEYDVTSGGQPIINIFKPNE